MNSDNQNSVFQNIILFLKDKKIGTTFIYDDFAECGSYTAIRSAVVKLCKSGHLRRICQGVYVKSNSDGTFTLPNNIHIALEIDRRNSDYTAPYGTTLDYIKGKLKQMPNTLYFNTHGSTRIITLPDNSIVKYRKIKKE